MPFSDINTDKQTRSWRRQKRERERFGCLVRCASLLCLAFQMLAPLAIACEEGLLRTSDPTATEASAATVIFLDDVNNHSDEVAAVRKKKPTTRRTGPTHDYVSERNHAGATNHPLCSDVARRLLDELPDIPLAHVGVAAMICEGVTNPMDSGIGGGFQALMRNKRGIAHHVVARERSPTDKRFLARAVTGGNAIGVPSALYGYADLLGIAACFDDDREMSRLRANATTTRRSGVRRRGNSNRRTWTSAKNCAETKISTEAYRRLLEPSRVMACAGFEPSRILVEMYQQLPRLNLVAPLSEDAGERMQQNRSSSRSSSSSSSSSSSPTRAAQKRVRNPALCNLLSHLMKHPVALMTPYRAKHSVVRNAMLRDVRASGSFLTASDFAAYRSSRFVVSPIELTADTIGYVPGQPSSARSVAFFYSAAKRLHAGRISPNNVDAYLSLVRDAASYRIYDREGFETRRRSSAVPLQEKARHRADANRNSSFGRGRDGLTRVFHPSRLTFPRLYVQRTSRATSQPMFLGGTSNIVIARGKREAFVATSSINHRFGSMTLSRSLGIPYNDQLRDFVPSSWRFGDSKDDPKKTTTVCRERLGAVPPSSMSPIVLTDRDGRTIFAGGASGGPKIPMAVATTLWQLITDPGIPLQTAVARERLTVAVFAAVNRSEVWMETPRSGYGRDTLEAVKKVRAEALRKPRKRERVGVRYGPRDMKTTMEAGYSAVTAVSRLHSSTGIFDAAHDIRRGGSSWSSAGGRGAGTTSTTPRGARSSQSRRLSNANENDN